MANFADWFIANCDKNFFIANEAITPSQQTTTPSLTKLGYDKIDLEEIMKPDYEERTEIIQKILSIWKKNALLQNFDLIDPTNKTIVDLMMKDTSGNANLKNLGEEIITNYCIIVPYGIKQLSNPPVEDSRMLELLKIPDYNDLGSGETLENIVFKDENIKDKEMKINDMVAEAQRSLSKTSHPNLKDYENARMNALKELAQLIPYWWAAYKQMNQKVSKKWL